MSRKSSSTPPCPLKPGSVVHGFDITRVTHLPPLRATVIEAHHRHSGAQVLHVFTDDTENLCAVAFRTPPPDDTGVPHILEHSVLGGSRKFPVKDPFLEMVKRSMATFINALTYSDKTVYPVASNVRKDFFNLVDVYLDAVFHPTITPETLKQEGHHLEFADPADPASPLVIKGIVYNEMKGAYSELDSLIGRVTSQLLFPDTPYGRDSGGDPAAIPQLTYEQFRGFHERLYHPANSFTTLYGNIPTADTLAFLDERLREMPPPPADLLSEIPRQPRWNEPRRHVEPYPLGPDEDPKDKAAVLVSWLLGDAADPETEAALMVVDHLLLGHDGSLLHKALIESHLGEDLAPSGFSSGTLESSFHVGLKGTNPEKANAIVALIHKTLEQAAAEPFSRDQVEAAFQQLCYAQCEISEMYPMRLMDRVLDAWIYGLDPLLYLRLGEILDAVWKRYEQEPDLFNRLIRERFVANPHQLIAVFVPDPALQTARDTEFAAAMAARKAAMSADELRTVAAETAALERRQNAPNTPEALATLPVLHLSDLPKTPREIPCEIGHAGRASVPLVRTPIFANGVNYFHLAFDLNGLPENLWPYLPVFADFLPKLGTPACPWEKMGERIAACTGAFGAGVFSGTQALAPEKLLPHFSLSFKSLDRRHPDALAVVRDLLLEPDFDDTARLRDLVLQARIQQQSGILHSGHMFTVMQAARSLSPLAALGCVLNGLPQVRLAGVMAKHFDAEVEKLREAFRHIRRFLLNAMRLRAAFTGSEIPAGATGAWLEEFADGITAAALPSPTERLVHVPAAHGPEGLAFASEVAFCAASMPAPSLLSPDAAPLTVFSRLLALGYLWEEIRAKGGAYGGMCSYDPAAGVFSLMSYRDPNIARTLDVFRGVPAALQTMPLTADDIERGIISVAKAEERPIRPASATSQALWRHLTGLTPEIRKQRYAALLEVTGPAVRDAAARLLETGLPQLRTCVLAGRPMLTAANTAGAGLKIENVLA